MGCAPRAAYDAGERLVRAGKAARVLGDDLMATWSANIDPPALAPRNDPR